MMANVAPIKIPLLSMGIDVDDETDAPSTECTPDNLTGRSNTDSGEIKRQVMDSAMGKRKLADVPIVDAQGRKMRKSIGDRNQKKPLQIMAQSKNTAVSRLKAAVQGKSLIPRLKSLSPSSSSTSLATFESNTGRLSPIGPSLFLTEDTTILCRIRKSISQMDLKQARRTGQHYPIIESKARYNGAGKDKGTSGALIPQIRDAVNQASQSVMSNKFFTGDNYYYVTDQRDSKMIGMKIYAQIMLNAWRKRRDDVKRLTEEISFLKTLTTKSKNQVHVCNSLFSVEKKRNEDLINKLQHLAEAVNTSKSSCETLTTSLISIKADKAFLETQLEIKTKECNVMNITLTQTKSELFKTMAQNRELQSELSGEERKVQWLESQKNDLISEICELKIANEHKEKKMNDELEIKTKELSALQEEIKRYEKLAATLEEQEVQLKEDAENEAKLKEQLEEMKIEIETLQQRLNNTIGNRINSYLCSARDYHLLPLQLLHWIAFYLLPAMPPPRITSLPFGLSMEKVFSIVKD